MNHNRTLALLFLLHSIVLLHGQTGHPHFRNYSTADGLPSSEVYTAFEDSQGYIWFGTDNGVSRFNGYEFENFGASEGLMDNVVFHIKEDSQGRIWMNTMSGRLFYFDNGRIHSYFYNHILIENKSKIITPTGFQFRSSGELVIGLRGWGILEIDTLGNYKLLNESLDASMFVMEIEEEVIYASVSYRNLTEAMRQMQLSQQLNKFCLIRPDTNLFLTLEYNAAEVINNFRSFRHADNYQLLIGNILLKADTNFQLIGTQRINRPLAAAIPNARNELWLGLIKGNGIRRYQDVAALALNQFETYLEGHSISWVIQDRSGGYWFTSVEDGIFYTHSLSYQVFDEAAGLSGNNVSTLARKTDSTFYVGIRTGSIYQFNSETQRIQLIKSSDKLDEIHDLAYDPAQEQLWKAGTRLSYLHDGKWYGVTNENSSFKLKLAGKRLHISRDLQSIWSCYHAGFHFININAKQLAYSSSNFLPPRRTLVVFEDQSARMWIGTVDGLFEYRDSLLAPPGNANPIFKMRVEDINQLSNGALVLATKGGGVAIWKGEKIVIVDESAGLTSNMVENLHIDSQQTIWVGTLAGLNKISVSGDIDHYSVETITLAHGLPSNEINDILVMGPEAWIATTKGLVKIPIKKKKNPNTYPPILQSAHVNNQRTKPATTSYYPYQSNNWQFQFFSPNYKFPGKIPYRFRISSTEGWSYTTNPTINFAKLAPGSYTFEVQAQNEDQLWSDSLLVPFVIKEPFWQLLSFQLLVISALLGFVVFLFQRRLKRIQQEAATQQEINELKRAALQAQMNPHFVFNCLNSIQQFIAIGDKRNALHYLSRFAQLIRNTLQASTKTRIALEDEVNMLSNYIELEKARFGNRFDFTITLDPKIDGFELEIPPLLIQPYVENAIIHGVNNLDRKGQIDITYALDGNDLKVSVSDNGVGIYQSKQAKGKSDASKQSLGMSITQKRLQLVQAIESTDDPVSITERKNAEGQVMGTTIEILLKNLNAEPKF